MEAQSDSCDQFKASAMAQVKKEEDAVLPPSDECLKNGVLRLPNGGARTTPDAAVLVPDQLTIFCNGNVAVFDAIPAEKVREIMLIATSAAVKSKAASGGPVANSPILTRSPSLQSATNGLPINPASPLCKLQAELPIARRHSLQRFFEKRRDRLGSKSPYPAPTAGKKAETAKPDLCGEVSAAGEKEIQPQVA